MERLDEWCTTGRIAYAEDEIAYDAPVSAAAPRSRAEVAGGHPARAACSCLMLGDTSMGMINGYFGPRLLNRHRLHRAQGRPGLDHRSRASASTAARIDDAFALRAATRASPSTGGEKGAEDFDEDATREQLRDYLAVLDLVERVQGRLPRLAVPARPHPAAAAVRLRRGAAQLDVPARVERRHRSPAPPRPTRATSCRWR